MVDAFSEPATVRFILIEEITVFCYFEVGWSVELSLGEVTKLWLKNSLKPIQAAFLSLRKVCRSDVMKPVIS